MGPSTSRQRSTPASFCNVSEKQTARFFADFSRLPSGVANRICRREAEAWAMTQLASAVEAGKDDPETAANPAAAGLDHVGDELDSRFNEATE